MIPRLFIVEGPDNCGKSTLSEYIATRFNAVYWRLTSGQGLCEHDAMRLYQANALDNAKVNIDLRRSVVLDRHWPSDQVYGKILRGRPSISGELLSAVKQQCRGMNVIYINCWRDNAVMEHAKQKDPDHPYEDEVYAKVVASYQEFFAELEKTETVVPYYLDSFLKQKTLLPAFLEGLSKL